MPYNKSYGAIVGFSVNKEETITLPPESNELSKVTLETLPRTVSGSSLNVVRTLISLGSAAKLLYTVGHDLHSYDVTEALTGWSIDGFPLRVRVGTPRTIVVIPSDDHKSTKLYCHKPLYDKELMSDACKDVHEQVGLCQPKYLVATGVRFDDLSLVQALFEGLGKKVLNPSYELMKEHFSLVQELSHGLDLLVVNHEEVCAGLGKPPNEFNSEIDVEELFGLLNANGILVTHNSCGSFYCSAVPGILETIHQPSFKVEVVDPTGAGDAFLGGFLHCQLEGCSVDESIEFASACAAAKIQKIGGSNVPTKEEVLVCLNKFQ